MLPLLNPALAAFTFKLDVPTPSLNEIRGLHHKAYRGLRKGFQMRVWAGLVQHGHRLPPTPLQQVGIVIERHSAGLLDWDNAYGGLKPLLDCLVAPSRRNPDGLGLFQDDSPLHMPEPPYVRQLKAPPEQGFTVVRIYDLANPEIMRTRVDSTH